MLFQKVTCSREFNTTPNDLWNTIKSFDISWHPFVETCDISHNSDGATIREFQTNDGRRLVERQTYISDTDHVLRYAAISGIEGLNSYTAEVTVSSIANGKSLVTWQADISAQNDRCIEIANGTEQVFKAALESLELGLPQKLTITSAEVIQAQTKECTIEGSPSLSFLTSKEEYPESKTLVLFLHGIGGQASNWSKQIEACGKKYKVAALNLRGYGNSELGQNQTQVDDYCEDILAVASYLACDRLILVGLSLGSWIATSFAMRHSDKLDGIVLAGGCTGMSEAAPQEREHFLAARQTPLAEGKSPADFADDVIKVIAGPNAANKCKQALRESMQEIPTETYQDAIKCFCDPTEIFDFSKLSFPVLLITGEHDRLASQEEIRGVANRIHSANSENSSIADVRFEVIKKAGHVCNLEQPAAFNFRLKQFLQKVYPA